MEQRVMKMAHSFSLPQFMQDHTQLMPDKSNVVLNPLMVFMVIFRIKVRLLDNPFLKYSQRTFEF